MANLAFESFANSKRYKTCNLRPRITAPFESFANSKRYKTPTPPGGCAASLRALLIQKDTKQLGLLYCLPDGLRALPIQKDTKHVKSEVKRMIV